MDWAVSALVTYRGFLKNGSGCGDDENKFRMNGTR
jgi:hypothetical protein